MDRAFDDACRRDDVDCHESGVVVVVVVARFVMTYMHVVYFACMRTRTSKCGSEPFCIRCRRRTCQRFCRQHIRHRAGPARKQRSVRLDMQLLRNAKRPSQSLLAPTRKDEMREKKSSTSLSRRLSRLSHCARSLPPLHDSAVDASQTVAQTIEKERACPPQSRDNDDSFPPSVCPPIVVRSAVPPLNPAPSACSNERVGIMRVERADATSHAWRS